MPRTKTDDVLFDTKQKTKIAVTKEEMAWYLKKTREKIEEESEEEDIPTITRSNSFKEKEDIDTARKAALHD